MNRFGPPNIIHCFNAATAAGAVTLWHSMLRGDHKVYAKCSPKCGPCLSRSCSPGTCPVPPPSPDCMEKVPPCGQQSPSCDSPCDECPPVPECEEPPPQMELRQAHVFFKHSYTTPLNTSPRMPQAEYDHTLVMREHLYTLFPYEKLDACKGEPVDYSDYQKRVDKRTLRGGAYPGALTGYGKDQMYVFGKFLRDKYAADLGLCCYDPRLLNVLSTNVRRTVESARCVLAGMFTAKQLRCFSCEESAVPIYVTSPNFNILIPDTFNCKLLKDVNHASMIHSDFIPEIKETKMEIEDWIECGKESLLEEAITLQEKIDQKLELREIVGATPPCRPSFNKFRQKCLVDDEITPLMLQRSQALEKIPYFWVDVFCRVPSLQKSLTEDDIKGLSYLKRLEVESFDGKFQQGYRYTFYFDTNPYFHNKVMQKEVYLDPCKGCPTSYNTPIQWKLCGSLLPGRSCGPCGAKSPSECILEGKDYDEAIRCFEGQEPCLEPLLSASCKAEEEDGGCRQDSCDRLNSCKSPCGKTPCGSSPKRDKSCGPKDEKSCGSCPKDDKSYGTCPKDNKSCCPKDDKSCGTKDDKSCGPKDDKSCGTCPKNDKSCGANTQKNPCKDKKSDPRQLYRECPSSCRKKPCPPPALSFFSWLTTNVKEKCDPMGKAIREEIWPDPLCIYQETPSNLCIPERTFDFIFARNDIAARTTTGHLIPYWLTKFACTIERTATRILYNSVAGQTDKERPLVSRLAVGPLLYTVFDRIKKEKKCANGPKLCLYSCHDSTMVALLEALDIWDDQWPVPGAHIDLEVYEDINTSDFYVKVLYNNREQVIRSQDDTMNSWCSVRSAMKPFAMNNDCYATLCASDALKKMNPNLLKHEQCSRGKSSCGS